MTNQMKAAVAAMLMVGSVAAQAQTSTEAATSAKKTTHKPVAKKAPAESATSRELRELREKQAAQQAQIDTLMNQIAAKDAALASAQQSAAAATTAAQTATAQAQAVTATVQAQSDDVQKLKSNVSDLQTTNVGLASTISANKQELSDKIESPTALHYKGVLIQPFGFVAAETVTRTRTMNSDINTPFSATPYMNTDNAFMSETNFSGRQSRLGVQVTAPLSWGKAGAYYEMDFLAAAENSNDNQTNSYVLRQREAWGQVATNKGFTFTGGQMWGLITETKKGMAEAPGLENLPQTIDAQYHVGFSFTRQYGLRLTQALGKISNIGVSLEESQVVLKGSNAPDNFLIGGQGATGGQYTSVGSAGGAQNYSNNVAPDIFVKYTVDPKFGHFEVGGAVRFFRDRVYAQPAGYSTTVAGTGPGVNYTTPGGGFFVNARVHATKFADLGVHGVWGPGMGRYGTSNLGDVVVRPTGQLEPIKSGQGLATIETHPTKKLDVFGYAGAEYLQRTIYLVGTTQVGYAPNNLNLTGCSNPESPVTVATGYTPNSSSCSPATRAIMEGTAGFTYRFFNSPTKGRFQYSMTYSFLEQSAWTGINTHDASGYGSPKGTNNMIFTGFRYYMP